MAARTRVLLAALLVGATALAGCTDSDGGDTTPPPATPAPDVQPTPPPANGGGDEPAPPARPADFQLTDAGSIQGPMDKSWDVDVPNLAYTHASLSFTLTGAQPDAPPTARVHLSLQAPDGTPVREAVIGLGGDGDAVAWTFAPGELPQAGTYKLLASSASDSPLPSAGFAEYHLQAQILY